jgi:biopolymer transport protein ExbD
VQSVKVAEVNSAINVTPLVDVMLVLLIIFMVITPMLQKGPPVIIPKASNPPQKPEEKTQILITVSGSKDVYVDKEKMPDDAQFAARIAEEYVRNKNATVVMKGDARLTYGDVKKVMLKVKEVGFEQVGLITQRQDQ